MWTNKVRLLKIAALSTDLVSMLSQKPTMTETTFSNSRFFEEVKAL